MHASDTPPSFKNETLIAKSEETGTTLNPTNLDRWELISWFYFWQWKCKCYSASLGEAEAHNNKITASLREAEAHKDTMNFQDLKDFEEFATKNVFSPTNMRPILMEFAFPGQKVSDSNL
jgi:hypothetical protein